MVSIVMPAYNASKTIGDSIKSIQAQTVKEWELIVIDDGSTDNTSLVVAEYSLKDTRIKFIRNEKNNGVSYTRNRAVELAKGEWIAFLDSDDVWEPKKLEKQLALTKVEPNMVICYTASSFMNECGKPYNYIMEAEERLTYKLLLRKNLISCSSVMIKSSVMKKLKMPSDKMHEDYFTWLKVVKHYGVAHGINEPLLIYRVSSNSKSGNRVNSAKMLYNTYNAIGYSKTASIALTLRYSLHSLAKRHNIYKSI